ncbi:FliH/SctL family protein [Melioribacteraceae bacterium 4301-Me]|uniref:FliH/SctL family protein n=1 Tax=Pyranulibacter aquaticus TaxID=3163344 RepID=UPI00359745A9
MSSVIKIQNKKKINIKKLDSVETDIIESKEKKEKDLIEAAFSEGFEKGYLKCKEELEKNYSEKIQKRMIELDNLLASINNIVKTYEDSFEKTVLEVSFLISEKIIKEKIDKNTPINEVLTQAMKKVIGANNVIIKINPSDYDKLHDESKAILSSTAYSKIKFETDDKIEPGGCLIETDIGNVDGRVSAQLKEIRRMLETINIVPEV